MSLALASLCINEAPWAFHSVGSSSAHASSTTSGLVLTSFMRLHAHSTRLQISTKNRTRKSERQASNDVKSTAKSKMDDDGDGDDDDDDDDDRYGGLIKR